MKLLAVLEHPDYNHTEYWYESGDKIRVIGNYPCNYPSESSHELSYLESLRQFTLLTSTEGWYLDEDSGWHDYVESHGV